MNQSTTSPLITSARVRRELAELNELTAMVKSIRESNDRDCAACRVSTETAAAIAGVDPATLRRARELREAKLKAGEPLDPYHVSSMATWNEPDGSRSVDYACSEVLAYLERRRGKAMRAVEPRQLPPQEVARATRGLSSFLALGDALSSWPFAIQADGRPLDLAEAIVDKLADGIVERLTLTEFSTRLATAAAGAFHEGEREALGESPEPGELGEPDDQRDRWSEHGGPI